MTERGMSSSTVEKVSKRIFVLNLLNVSLWDLRTTNNLILFEV